MNLTPSRKETQRMLLDFAPLQTLRLCVKISQMLYL